jgi:hypothetical protein
MSDDGSGGKRDGMRRAALAADPHWHHCMMLSAKEIAWRKPFFDTEDIVRWCREHHPNATTHEMRAIGPLMRNVVKQGFGEPIDEWNMSTLPQCHRRPMRAYRSLIYRGPNAPARPRRRRKIDPRQYLLNLFFKRTK